MWWYEDEVKDLENRIANRQEDSRVCFYGSSSIRLWESLEQDYMQLRAINLGFGGSTLAACVWFFPRIFKDLQPDVLVVYAGDNDLGDGRTPEEVFIFYKQLVRDVRERLGDIPVFFISIKPSLARKSLDPQIRFANELISKDISNQQNTYFIDVHSKMLKNGVPDASLFTEDGLHMNHLGYKLWKHLVTEAISPFL